MSKQTTTFKYPGIPAAMDGNSAVIMCEREASDAAGAYPITPSTQMGEYWAEEVSKGHVNVSGRPLIFIEPESEHAAAGVTAGMSMSGLRATNFSSSQGVAFMHESLYAAVGKRLPYVLNMGCRAITKATLNVHCGHDDYHCIDDTGFIQVMAKSAQEAADLNLIARKLAELALTPAVIAQDGFLTTHLIESMRVPERELIAEFLGRPDDVIECPTAAQKLIFGETRRRVPLTWDVDNPVMSGVVQNQDSYMQAVAAQRPYFFAHVAELADKAMDEFYQLTGRRYHRVSGYRTEDADYLILGQGSVVVQAEAVADYLGETRKLKVGVVNLTMYRPFPGDLIGHLIKGKKGVVVLERTDQPMAEDLPLMRELRAAITKCQENHVGRGEEKPYPKYDTFKPGDAPRLYSACFGLGSRDLQPEGIIGAVENMLPGGKHRKFFYLAVDFLRDKPANPKQEIHQQKILDAYPQIGELAVHGSENPNLMPEGAITARIHSVGGWGAITTGKNLAMTLYDLLGFDIKANPKYGSEKKGQPTTYYLSAAPHPIRVNCEYHYVDVAMSPDPNVFSHSNPLHGLKKGGVFIIQSDLDAPEKVWAQFPREAQRFVVENDIRVFYVDGFKIAREEATNPELQFRMQGNAFQGAFFAASDVAARAGLTHEKLFRAIEDQLKAKFGSKGARVVEDNLRVVRRGFTEVHEIAARSLAPAAVVAVPRYEAGLPALLKGQAPSADRRSDLHRFWEQVGWFYRSGEGSDVLADPFAGMSLMPAASGVFRDMTQIRLEYPRWIAENCTACGDCYNVCPDTAIAGLVTPIADVFNTALSRIETGGRPTRYLRRAVRTVEKKLRDALMAAGKNPDVRALLDEAIAATVAESVMEVHDKERLTEEMGWLKEALGDFQFSLTKVYFTANEKKVRSSGGLYSITVNPNTCKGCMECVAVCDDAALERTPQTTEAVARLRRDWDFWQALPNTPQEFLRVRNLDEAEGALKNLLLDKTNFGSMNCGDGACFGCGEKTAIHLFTGTVTALMQGRVQKHVEYLDGLIARLERHIRVKLAETMDLSDTAAVTEAVSAYAGQDLTLSRLTARLDAEKGTHPIDTDWLKRTTGTLEKLKDLKWRYAEGTTHGGRARMGFINATGCTSVWGSTYPYNPYPFPWTSHLFQDAPSVAMGVFEGHMAKMAEGFKAIRTAELELKDEYDGDKHDKFFTYFDWRQFSEEEFKLCPPVVAVGGDGAMYDIGFQNLSRMLMSGMPIKVLVVDTQVYSNTGGQSCTSGFIGQIADMAPYGERRHGKQEIRKEMSLIGMAHRTAYVMQGSISNLTNLIEGYIEGLNSRRPALFNIYAVCQPEHGVADDKSFDQSKLAVESRAYPLLRFNPDKGKILAQQLSLDGNPARDQDWPKYKLSYTDEEGKAATMELPMTFADFAFTEGRFRKHFKRAPRETWNDGMVPLAEFLELEESARQGKYPYIWAVDGKNRLQRILVSEELVRSSAERRDLWRLLRSLAKTGQVVDVEKIAADARAEVLGRVQQGIAQLAGGAGAQALAGALGAGVVPAAAAPAPAAAKPAAAKVSAEAKKLPDYEPMWIETPECTACDECININANIFVYNDDKKVVVKNARGGSYRDIVNAAEKCTARVIHPGTPWDPNEPDLDKLVARAAAYQ
jgi:pyruvate-ferredoxin/flavodoxin oxidoreductase